MSDLFSQENSMKGVIPYLTIDGVDAAIAFYQKALGAILHGEVTRGESGKVMNVALEINQGMIMLCDHFPEMGDVPAQGGRGFLMQIVTYEGQLLWDRAIEAGCEIVAPFEVQFWGDTWGRFKDQFGIEWAVNQPSQANREKAANL